PMALRDARAFADDPRYRDPQAGTVVVSESLADVVRRVRPFWDECAAPAIREGRNVVIQAHGNSIRALIKHLDGMSDVAIAALDVPNATPIVYEFDADLQVRRRYDMPAGEGAGRHSLF
ncbi:MAG: 2,3-bisphosphoglycerate-dependent phosphoglycerate mutase, partial [Oxalobacteraceae bacterium]